MKTAIIICFLFILFAETSAQVAGKITNPDNQPVSLANVSLLSKRDSTRSGAALTDETGSFSIENILPGMYFLQVTNIGYQNWHSPVFEINANEPGKDFGTIKLIEDKRELGEVIVRAEKPLYQQKPEGTIINVESSLLAKGSSALEILERSPGVYIDYRNNSIALNGKNGVVVLINGKQMRMSMSQLVSFLSSMTANDIEKIELLTTPPANYDAEGTAGMINIVLKKTKKKGTNAFVSLTGGYGRGEKATGSMNMGHNNGVTDIYASYSFSHDRNPTDFTAWGSEIVPILGGDLTFDFSNKSRPVRNNHNASIGVDKKINPKTNLGGSINFNSSHSSTMVTNHTTYNALPDSIMLFDGTIKGSSRWKNIISSAYAERKIKEGEKISIDLDYLDYNTNSPTDVQSSFIDKHGNGVGGNNSSQFSPVQQGFSSTKIKVGVIKADYSKDLTQKIKLEAGVKGSYTKSSSISGIRSLVNGTWINRNGTTNNIDMKESISAIYMSFASQINESTRLTAGVRYEYTRMHAGDGKTDSITIERKSGKFFPSVFLSKKLNERSELIFSYTRRISRPTYNDLTSFIAYNDPISVFTGNPLLKPAITNNLKLGYNYRSYSFSLLLSRDDNPILQGQLTPGPRRDLVYISPQNAAWQNNITLEMTLPVKVNNWWNMNYGFTGGWRQFRLDYLPQPYTRTYYAYAANFSQSFKLPRNYSAEISGWYNSRQYGGNARVNGYGALNAGIKKELKNNGGTFQLTVTDFLQTINVNLYIGYNAEDAFSTKARVSYNAESRRFPIIKLTYSRSFGTALKNVRKQNNSSTDERDRIRRE
jgi:iron complex outermembrane recepter protein